MISNAFCDQFRKEIIAVDLLLYLLGKSPNILISRYCRNFICIAAGKVYCLCNGTAIYNILLDSPVRVSAYKRKNCVEADFSGELCNLRQRPRSSF